MRVAGPVVTDVRPHALGTPQAQVIARVGDALIYLADQQLAARIRQQWDAAQYLVARRLPERVSQTWLAPEPGTYPVGVTVHLTGEVKVTTQSVSAHQASRTPAHLRMSVDRRLVWQVCDRQSWRAIGNSSTYRAGAAGTHTDVWTQALAAARAALLAGELDTLAVTVDDDQPTALYDPGRDEPGELDPADVTADLVEIHQNATAGELADQLIAHSR